MKEKGVQRKEAQDRRTWRIKTWCADPKWGKRRRRLWSDLPYLPGKLAWEVTVRQVLHVTLVAVLVVHDLHLSVVVHPQSTHDDVVYRRRHLAPRVVVARRGEHQVRNTCKWSVIKQLVSHDKPWHITRPCFQHLNCGKPTWCPV